ncbi:MAG TPA: FMN reductase [Kineosporiaceae bacterium]|nr:FMN reductase [Kineosporiaceae bacterium]
MTRLMVVSAGLSQPSSTRLLGERLADATRSSIEAGGGTVAVEVVDLRDLAHDVVNNVLTGFPAPALARVLEQIAAAQALIAVTPIFNASYSGLFKSFFDVLTPDSLRGKPVLIGATGGSQRHSLALEHAVRPLFSYLRAVVVPTSVYAASSDWGTADGSSALAERIDRAGAELADLVTRTAPTAATGPVDPFANPPSFLDLLGR